MVLVTQAPSGFRIDNMRIVVRFIVFLGLFSSLSSFVQPNEKSKLIQNLGKDTQINSLLITNDNLFLANLKGELLQYKFNKGKYCIEHLYKLNSTIIGKPVIGRNDLTIVAGDYSLFCFTKNGKLKWKTGFPGLIKSELIYSDDKIFVDSRGAGIYCLNVSNGEIIWRYLSDAGTIGGMSIQNHRLIVSDLGHRLLCLNSITGNVIWKKEISDYFFSAPQIAEGFLISNFYNTINPHLSFLGIFDINNGKQLLKKNELVNARYKPLLLSSGVVFGTEDSKIIKIEPKTGKKLWQFVLPEADVIGNSLFSTDNNNAICLTGINRVFYKINALNGQLVFKEKFDYGLSELFNSRGKILFLTGDGNLYVN